VRPIKNKDMKRIYIKVNDRDEYNSLMNLFANRDVIWGSGKDPESYIPSLVLRKDFKCVIAYMVETSRIYVAETRTTGLSVKRFHDEGIPYIHFLK
jgi:hypothetical protein